MKLQEILDVLERDVPLQKAEQWDNCGLQTGRRDKSVHTVYIALDPTQDVIERAISCNADLLLTHHPMTLSGLKQIHTDHFIARKFFMAIQKDLCCYAMHTNYDIVKMGELAAKKIDLVVEKPLEVTGTDQNGRDEGFGRTGELKHGCTLEDCAELIKDKFQLNHVRIFGDPARIVKRVSILPGSGKSMTADALKDHSEVYITGDMGHHDGLDAIEQNLCVIDAGHYGLEHIFIDDMQEYVKTNFPDLKVIKDPGTAPFQIR